MYQVHNRGTGGGGVERATPYKHIPRRLAKESPFYKGIRQEISNSYIWSDFASMW